MEDVQVQVSHPVVPDSEFREKWEGPGVSGAEDDVVDVVNVRAIFEGYSSVAIRTGDLGY